MEKKRRVARAKSIAEENTIGRNSISRSIRNSYFNKASHQRLSISSKAVNLPQRARIEKTNTLVHRRKNMDQETVSQILATYDACNNVITGLDPKKQTPQSIFISKVLAEGLRRKGQMNNGFLDFERILPEEYNLEAATSMANKEELSR